MKTATIGKIKKVSIFTSQDQYGAKIHFASKLKEAFQRQEIETQLLNMDQFLQNGETVAKVKQFAPDLTCAFNRLDARVGGFLGDLAAIPHLSVLQEPSFYFTDLVNTPNSILATVDQSDCHTIQSAGFESVFFWPHAVEPELCRAPEQEKKYDLVLIGSCYDYESLRMAWRARNPEPINKILDEAIDLLFSLAEITTAEALVRAWNRSGYSQASVDFASLFTYLDYYTRGKERVELIRSIKDAKVDVFGELSVNNPVGILGWQPYLANQSNIALHPSVSYPEGLTILKQAKIALNSSPQFRYGSHERVLSALACGALAVTSESRYLRAQFQKDEGVVFYQAAELSSINECINDLLANAPGRIAAVAKGRKKILEHHTWDKRVEQLQSHLRKCA